MGDEDDATFELVRSIFAEKIPFNAVLGIEIDELSYERVRLRLPNRSELMGNFIRGSLHGGVISATLDLTGGLIAFLSAIKNMGGGMAEEKVERLAKVGTIDLRVDYLRPGIGECFLVHGGVLRAGNKVVVTRMELENEDGDQIAVGTGAYLVG